MRETEEQRGWEDNLTIPDYVMWDFERYGCERKEQEVTVTQKGSNQRKPTAKRASGPAYWLIKKSENGRIEMLTFYGGDVLPVFSFGEEAEMFHRFSGVGDDWQVSESEAEELVSVLYGPIAGVKEVALDPLPEMVAERTLGLISLRRARFMEFITARRRASSSLCEPGRGSSQREDEQNRRSEADRIAAQCSPGRLA